MALHFLLEYFHPEFVLNPRNRTSSGAVVIANFLLPGPLSALSQQQGCFADRVRHLPSWKAVVSYFPPWTKRSDCGVYSEVHSFCSFSTAERNVLPLVPVKQ